MKETYSRRKYQVTQQVKLSTWKGKIKVLAWSVTLCALVWKKHHLWGYPCLSLLTKTPLLGTMRCSSDLPSTAIAKAVPTTTSLTRCCLVNTCTPSTHNTSTHSASAEGLMTSDKHRDRRWSFSMSTCIYHRCPIFKHKRTRNSPFL